MATIRPMVRYQSQGATSIRVAVVDTRVLTGGGSFRSRLRGRRSLPPRGGADRVPGPYAAWLGQRRGFGRDDEDTAWGYSPPVVTQVFQTRVPSLKSRSSCGHGEGRWLSSDDGTWAAWRRPGRRRCRRH